MESWQLKHHDRSQVIEVSVLQVESSDSLVVFSRFIEPKWSSESNLQTSIQPPLLVFFFIYLAFSPTERRCYFDLMSSTLSRFFGNLKNEKKIYNSTVPRLPAEWLWPSLFFLTCTTTFPSQSAARFVVRKNKEIANKNSLEIDRKQLIR